VILGNAAFFVARRKGETGPAIRGGTAGPAGTAGPPR